MSRIPIREALSRLEAEGLVRGAPFRGYAVPVLSRAETDNMLNVRMALETYMAGVLTDVLDDSTIDRLEQACKLTEAAVDAGDSFEYVRHGSSFHRTMIRACKNPVLERVMALTNNRYLVYQQFKATPQSEWRMLNAEHWHIVTALRARDKERIRHTMMAHFYHVRNALQAYLDSIGPAQAGIETGPRHRGSRASITSQ